MTEYDHQLSTLDGRNDLIMFRSQHYTYGSSGSPDRDLAAGGMDRWMDGRCGAAGTTANDPAFIKLSRHPFAIVSSVTSANITRPSAWDSCCSAARPREDVAGRSVSESERMIGGGWGFAVFVLDYSARCSLLSVSLFSAPRRVNVIKDFSGLCLRCIATLNVCVPALRLYNYRHSNIPVGDGEGCHAWSVHECSLAAGPACLFLSCSQLLKTPQILDGTTFYAPAFGLDDAKNTS